MKLLLILPVFLLGCAATPEQMAGQSDWDVCRFTMGGPHAAVAESERRRRGLDCRPLYPAINSRMANENAATQRAIQSMQRQPVAPPVSCTSYRAGNTVQTDCR